MIHPDKYNMLESLMKVAVEDVVSRLDDNFTPDDVFKAFMSIPYYASVDWEWRLEKEKEEA